jgi:DNA polymerase (family 10)
MGLKENIISTLELYSDLLELKGENPFKISAIRNGANVLRQLEGEIEPLIQSGEIKNLKGIGKGLLALINEYNERHAILDFEKLRKQYPPSLLDMFNIRGLGAKKVKVIYDTLKISSLLELEEACRANKLSQVKGFGAKTEESILKSIALYKENSKLLSIAQGESSLNDILEKLIAMNSVKRAEPSGELRRWMEKFARLEFIVLTDRKSSFIDELKKAWDDAAEISSEALEQFSLSKEAAISAFVVEMVKHFPVPVFIYGVEKEEHYNEVLFKTTGSIGFISSLKLKDKADYSTEEKAFASAGMQYVIPEMREEGYFSLPETKRKNSELKLEDYKGLMHFHSTFSDGHNTVLEMFSAAEQFGFQYAAICDHSKSAFYANGLTEEKVLKQKEEIENLNLKIKAIQGIESDILRDGRLDYEPDFLKNFDFITASIHSIISLSEEEMTARIIKAVENEHTDMLSHPTGRLIFSREGYKMNIKKVIDACAANKVAIEINSNPKRLDLDWRNIYYAREKGCLFSINPDAHATKGIMEIRHGVKIARKGGIQPEEVINFFSLNDFITFLERKGRKTSIKQRI